MMSPDLPAAAWRKSSYSGEAGDCVEVASLPKVTAIRDSKDPDGGTLVLDAQAWAGLLSAVRSGELDPR